MVYLPLMHESGTDGSYQQVVVQLAQHEHQKNMTSCMGLANGSHARFFWVGVSHDSRCIQEDSLNVCFGDTVLATFGPIPFIPIKTLELNSHKNILTVSEKSVIKGDIYLTLIH